MSLGSNLQWAFQETFRGLKRDAGIYSFASLLCALAISIPLFIATVFHGLSEPLRSLPTAVEITVFSNNGANIEKLAADIDAVPGIIKTEMIAKADAFAELSKSLGMSRKNDMRNPLPDIVVATLKPDASAEEAEKTADAIKALKSVDFVAYEASWHEKFRAISRAGYAGVACVGSAVFLLVLLVLAAAVRMTSISAKAELQTLHLFGASPGFAIRPFVWRGAILTAASCLIAIGLAQCGILVFGQSVQTAASLYEAELRLALPDERHLAALVALSAFLGGAAAALSSRDYWRHLH